MVVAGPGDVRRHFAAEYGTAADAPSATRRLRLSVRFVDSIADPDLTDGHKTVRWSAALTRPAPRELELAIALRGRPRWFGLSLVQGYLVEPALSLLTPGAGGVLLPAASVVQDRQALVLVGGSGAGKSSLALRAVAAGVPLLGDDQVLITETGDCVRFPRRLRLYDDAERTAPAAVVRLPARYRLGLLARRLVRVATGGFVAPSLAVPAAALGQSQPPTTAPLGRVVLLARDEGATAVEVRHAAIEGLLDRCEALLADQRKRLVDRMVSTDHLELEAMRRREREILAAAFTSVPIIEVLSPSRLGAAQAVAAVAGELGLP